MKHKFCNQCGAALTEGARYCRKCGARFGTELLDATQRLDDAGSDDLYATAESSQPLRLPQTETLPGEASGENSATILLDPAAPAPPQTLLISPQMEQTETASTVTEEIPAAAQTISSLQGAATVGGRKGLLTAAAVLVLALAGAAYFSLNSGNSSARSTAATPTPAASQAAASLSASEPATIASNQSQAQTAPVGSEAQTSISPKAATATKPTAMPARNEAKPTPTSAPQASGVEQHLSTGTAALSAGRYQEALSEFEQVKKLAPENKDVYYLIGQTYHKLGQLDQALEAYRQCTAGVYASIAQNHVRTLEKRLNKPQP